MEIEDRNLKCKLQNKRLDLPEMEQMILKNKDGFLPSLAELPVFVKETLGRKKKTTSGLDLKETRNFYFCITPQN